MEEIYVNAEYFKYDNPIPSTINRKGPRSSKRSFYSGVTLSLGLLSVLLLIGLITLGVYLHDSTASLSATSSKLSSMTEERDHLKANLFAMRNNLSAVTEERDNLMANLSAMRNNLSSMTEERDHLNARLTEKTKELERLQSLSKQNKACPAGWRKLSCSCYLLSERSDSWDAARKDCRDREADLVVIDSSEEQMFLATVTKGNSWIGLNDKEQEGQWKWVDGTPLILSNWMTNEPNNVGDEDYPQWGEEDCAHDRGIRLWNDISCSASFKWICEKMP
ncbi:CD209 antigen-like protein C [Archocentrus centrarchus]|uniref:CD209 antigen-like protein C n=1 Tax=Archocentrus centrarchus TaxID=63155 RepID=UPI0011EA2D43|nr:CD209 antigen-like protein C [Archocentrus centrarchus]